VALNAKTVTFPCVSNVADLLAVPNAHLKAILSSTTVNAILAALWELTMIITPEFVRIAFLLAKHAQVLRNAPLVFLITISIKVPV
jgi:hypothetical protein